MRRARAILLAAAVALLAACAAVPRPAPPRVTVDAVRLDRLTGTEARFDVTVRLDNPNASEIAVAAIDAAVTVDDIAVGTATLKSPLRLPARGEATATIQARAGMSAVLALAASLAQRALDAKNGGAPVELRYAIAGTAVLEGGAAIPFARTGVFRPGSAAAFAR